MSSLEIVLPDIRIAVVQMFRAKDNRQSELLINNRVRAPWSSNSSEILTNSCYVSPAPLCPVQVTC